MVLLCCVVPAQAASYTVKAGTYVFKTEVAEPLTFFSVNLKFSCNGVSYTHIQFVPAGESASFPYGQLQFNGTRVCSWMNGVQYWSDDYTIIQVEFSQDISSWDFGNWLFLNTTFYPSSNNAEIGLNDYLGVVWESLGGYWSGGLLPDGFANFASVLSVFWDSPIIMRIVTLSVAFLVAGFVVFGESKHG